MYTSFGFPIQIIYLISCKYASFERDTENRLYNNSCCAGSSAIVPMIQQI